MGRPERALVSSALRLAHRFASEGIPCTGPAGTDLIAWGLHPVDLLANPAGPATSLEQGLRLLDRLAAQLEVLVASDDDTREALAQWADLQRRWGAAGAASNAADAALAAMDLFTAQADAITDPLGLGIDEVDDEGPATIEDMAAAVRERLPPGADAAAQASVVSSVMYGDFGLKYEPFEWVYEGMAPLLVRDTLKRRRGAPAALALAAAAVGRAAGVPLLPAPAAPIEAGAAEDPDAAVPVAGLPDDLALRVASSTQAAAPGPGPWLLRLCPDGDASEAPDVFLDAGTGEVMEESEAAGRYPAAGANLSGAEWRRRCALRSWQGLVRVAMQAAQRRGESDAVAQWMYVGLALDPGAPEWGRALSAPEVRAGP